MHNIIQMDKTQNNRTQSPIGVPYIQYNRNHRAQSDTIKRQRRKQVPYNKIEYNRIQQITKEDNKIAQHST